MIDNELDQLSRALIAATDRLNSEDFRARQERLVKLETDSQALLHKMQLELEDTKARLTAEHKALAEGLEADENAVVTAQEAVYAHCNPESEDEPTTSDDGLFQGDDEQPKASWSTYFEAGYKPSETAIEPLPTDEETWDETASAKAAGALS